MKIPPFFEGEDLIRSHNVATLPTFGKTLASCTLGNRILSHFLASFLPDARSLPYPGPGLSQNSLQVRKVDRGVTASFMGDVSTKALFFPG